ncbi:MAG: G8 domain-containing protein [Rubrobacteraceae bacterium]
MREDPETEERATVDRAIERETLGGWKRWATVLLAALLAAVITATLASPADSRTRARISVSPTTADPGASISTTGRCFPQRAKGAITFGGRVVARFTTTRQGGFSKRWSVPAKAKSGTVLAKASSRQASAQLKVRVPPPPSPQCADGRDNDGDGKTDHPADPGCSSVTDGSESPDPAPLPADAKLWSDPATWGGAVPQDGATVTIPAGKTIVLDQNATLANLTMEGTLIFDERDIELSADWIMVHGTLRIGTESAPFQHRANITLTDNTPGENPMNMGDKGLGVMGGTLEVHGENRLSWTKLGAHAAKGSNKITLSETPDWRPGDRIAIASTDYDRSQDEEATVTSVSGNTVTLDRQLQYAHWGTVQTFDGKPVDERAEVALLSRNVTIQGEPVSSASGFGGQIMVMDMTMNGMTQHATARLEGVELKAMGQKNILRRYPLHFHMLGDGGANSYLKDSSIHHTFNRCVTIHGTNQLQVHDNVCFDHIGHGFFFEDGAETDNFLEGNLGFGTREPEGEGLLPSDGNPATFWITNPDNIVRNNVAAGSDGIGFWLAFPLHPTGLSTNPNVWPRFTPLGEFSGNTAHSNDGDGLHVDGGPNPDGETDSTYYHPHENPPTTNDPDVPDDEEYPADPTPRIAEFRDFTGYKNRNEAVWLRGENHRLVNATLADNAIGATFASHESYLDDSLVVGETANKGNTYDWQVENGWVGLDGRSLPRYWEPDFPIRGFEFYDGLVGAHNTTFVNFTPNTQRKASGLGVLLADAFSLHPDNFATGLRFVDANKVYMPDPVAGRDGDASAVFVDKTGSVTGTIGAVVTANNPFLATGGCSLNNDWNAYVCPTGTDHVGLISYVNEGEAGKSLASYVKPLVLTRESDGAPQTLMGCCDDSTHAASNLLANRTYGAAFNGGTPKKAEFVLRHGAGRWLRLSMAYPVTPKVTKYGCDVAGTGWCGNGKATSLADLDSRSKSSYYYDASNQRLYLKLVAGDADWEALEIAPKP